MLQRDIVCVPGHLGGHLGIAWVSWNPVSFIVLVLCPGSHLDGIHRRHPPILGRLVHLCKGGGL
jgi:hypothetical protein